MVARSYRQKKRLAEVLQEQKEEITVQNEEIKAQNEQLALLNDQLKASEVILLELNGTKDKFFSIIAHDLKNPFSILQSLTNVLNTKYYSLD